VQQIWNIKSRAHECARTARPFEEGEIFWTAIYFDTEAADFVRRDVSADAWQEETAERTPIASWRTEYVKPESSAPRPEITTKESAESLLRRLIEDDEEHTEHARYILALMLERKKQLVPKETKHTESGIMLIYEHRKTGEVFILRDPELRLDEIEAVQEEVAMLLGFGGTPGAAGVAAAVTAENAGAAKAETQVERALETGDGTSEVTEERAAAQPDVEAGSEADFEAETQGETEGRAEDEAAPKDESESEKEAIA
jgi:hypothetical protein